MSAASPAMADEMPPVPPGRTITLPLLSGHGTPGGVLVAAGDTGIPGIAADGLRPWVAENLSADSARAFETLVNPAGFVPLDRTEEAGFRVVYDPQRALLRLQVMPESLKGRSLSLDRGNLPAYAEPVAPASHSAFLNMRSGMDYVHESAGPDGRQPVRADFDGAFNVRGWVIEGRADYVEGESRPWQRDDMRVVHDLPDRMVRLAAGDLSYPVSQFQSYAPMMGLSVARNFTLQPYRVTEPTGQESFLIRSPSRVDVIVNGRTVRTLQLEPGPYDISDFPVADGSNDVVLLITDATGNVEEKRFPLLSDRNLLKKGLHEYAYNVGIRSETEDRRIVYDGDRPAFSLFHRYGVDDTLTAGFAAQGDGDVQQAGLSAVKATPWGTFGADASGSHAADVDMGTAALLSYSFNAPQERRNFSASLQYRSTDFSSMGQSRTFNPFAWEAAARFNQAFPRALNVGIGGRYRWARGGDEDSWGYSLNVNRPLSPAVNLGASLQHERADGAGVFFNITWSPPLSRHSVSASADSLARTQDVRWNWRSAHALRAFQASGGVTRGEDEVRGTGYVGYTGYRGEAAFRHDRAAYRESGGGGESRTDSRSHLTMGSALVYADGHVALSRPVSNSFLLLSRHRNLKDKTVGINPEGDGAATYQARIDGMGPAVLPDMTPYMYRPVRVDTSNFPPGYDAGKDNYIVLPSYKSGTVLTVGSGANIFADGYLMFEGGDAARFQAGMIRRLDMAGQGAGGGQEFFTNAQGRFRIPRLEAGSYQIILHDFPDMPVSFAVPDAPPGRYDAGSLILSVNEKTEKKKE